jgi:hypothetical protein
MPQVTGRSVPLVHLVHEAGDRVGVGDEGARLDPGDRLPYVGVGVGERLESERRTDARVSFDFTSSCRKVNIPQSA